MNSAPFAGSLHAISDEWCLTHLKVDVERLPEGMPPTGALVLYVMAAEQVAEGDDVSRHVQTRLALTKKWDADIVAAHGLSKLERTGYLRLDERGLEETKAAKAANRFLHIGVCWALTPSGAIWVSQHLPGASVQQLLKQNQEAIQRARTRP